MRKQACGGGGFAATRHSCATGLRVGLSPHLLPACFPFGRYLFSSPVPRARRDVQHTCLFPHYLNVSLSSRLVGRSLMCDDGTAQYSPKRLRQPYFNARTTQTRAYASPRDL